MTLFRFCNTFIEGFRFQCVITSCRYMRNCMISLAWKSHGHQSCKFHHCMHLYLSSWLFVLLGICCALVVHLNDTFIVICKYCVRFHETSVRFICLFTETIIEVHGSTFRICMSLIALAHLFLSGIMSVRFLPTHLRVSWRLLFQWGMTRCLNMCTWIPCETSTDLVFIHGSLFFSGVYSFGKHYSVIETTTWLLWWHCSHVVIRSLKDSVFDAL